MRTGILVCGLNGSGKSTLGKALAEELGFHFIDVENLFFPKADSEDPYAAPRSRKEAEALLMDEVSAHGSFVFAAVRGDCGEEMASLYQYAVLIEVPEAIRLQRVRDRSLQRFGNRMLPGGDLYEREKSFFDMVCSRSDRYVEEWIQGLHCPVMRVDGEKPVEENVARIVERMQGEFSDRCAEEISAAARQR